jgi:hypothetical protein
VLQVDHGVEDDLADRAGRRFGQAGDDRLGGRLAQQAQQEDQDHD